MTNDLIFAAFVVGVVAMLYIQALSCAVSGWCPGDERRRSYEGAMAAIYVGGAALGYATAAGLGWI